MAGTAVRGGLIAWDRLAEFFQGCVRAACAAQMMLICYYVFMSFFLMRKAWPAQRGATPMSGDKKAPCLPSPP